MKKMIVIEEESNKNNIVKNRLYNFLISLLCYGIVLIFVSALFKNFYISNKYFGIYAIVAALIINILNKTIKPVLIILTLPINIYTMGLTYPIVNMIILSLTSFIMGNNFQINGFFTLFFASLLISIFNIFMDGLVVNKLKKDDN